MYVVTCYILHPFKSLRNSLNGMYMSCTCTCIIINVPLYVTSCICTCIYNN